MMKNLLTLLFLLTAAGTAAENGAGTLYDPAAVHDPAAVTGTTDATGTAGTVPGTAISTVPGTSCGTAVGTDAGHAAVAGTLHEAGTGPAVPAHPAARTAPAAFAAAAAPAAVPIGVSVPAPAPSKPRFRREHEIRFSAGYLPLLVDVDDWDLVFRPESFAGSKQYRGDTYTIGAYALGYSCRLSRRIDLTVALGYTHEYFHVYSNMDNSKMQKHGTHFFTVMPGIRANWMRRRNFRLYSAVGMGATFVSGYGAQSVERSFAVQVTLVGITFGNRLFGFAECGPGALGSFTGGIGYRFNAKPSKP